ncbi:hypothetical protein FRX31_002583 [Thalictrum thalictroides]|uniref:Uncharacterized protein n=1 Tax=Thalictrum thalictroides TaxID=46969 RepID=A0A7J6XH02_THATH|nr:hypothetical protein FRX31_002583 [Thalictrum thalictroides]
MLNMKENSLMFKEVRMDLKNEEKFILDGQHMNDGWFSITVLESIMSSNQVLRKDHNLFSNTRQSNHAALITTKRVLSWIFGHAKGQISSYWAHGWRLSWESLQ